MKEPDFEDLRARLAEKAFVERGQPQPLHAVVELSYGCNLRCVHCYNPTHLARNELSTDQFRRILEGLAEQGTLSVQFTGGELFTRSDSLELMRCARELGLVVYILTNATLIIPELADRLRELDPYQIDVSIYGATAKTYEKVTRLPGSFKAFLRGVELLWERALPLHFKIILMTINVHELDAMLEFAASRKVRAQVATDIQPKVTGERSPLAYRLSPEQGFSIWRRLHADRLLAQRSREASRAGGPPADGPCSRGVFDCGCGKARAAVTPYGKMNLCTLLHTPEYDLLQGSVAEGWKALVDFVARARPGSEYECPDCRLAEHCSRGTSAGWLEHGRFDGPCIERYRDEAERVAALFGEFPSGQGG